MSQLQLLSSGHHRIHQALAAISARDLVTDGDIAGFAVDAAAVDEQAILRLSGLDYTQSVIAAEEIFVGDRLYYNPVAGLLTKHRTEWFFGIAEPPETDIEYDTGGTEKAIAKPAFADDETNSVGLYVSYHRPTRAFGELEITLNFADLDEALQAIGDLTLRHFDADVQVYEMFVYGVDLPATTEISIGDGTGANEQLYVTTDGTTINAAGIDHWTDETTAVSPQVQLPVTLSDIVVSIGVLAATTGTLKIKARYL